ncbi:MAG: helix-turn-helix transcriptional regulator [Actinomycetota bacterium]|uniref:Helix-turn-helix transcriptional regulator n=1 Tax=Mycobacterium lentiflavum TaxID=141349 RepID=A0ABY3V2F2_MYCLN|nr:helix-turn-helix transcriptional regulator [Mycobacterium lentiflavum]MEE3067681.1 helix-turn-helix transcriptional regulator [Actinomycetota bacterium]ULP43828.1 helix-turn-helix transcriptional regulator [Mycobacterium lentiflavum]
MATKANALGDYLRARRQQVRPEDVGLVPGARRRVEGLRREELAMLAGISAEYYLRLEVGRDKNPSQQVIDALAQALRLEPLARQHLQYLAAPTGSDLCHVEAAPAYAFPEVINEFLIPAALVNRYLDVMAANPMARALSPEFTPGQNFLRWRLLDPAARQLYVNWDDATASAVSGLRDLGGRWPEEPRMRALVDELCSASDRFRELWPRADVGYRLGIHHYRHPLVGELYLHRSRLNAPYPGGEHVVMYRAEAGSVSAQALDELRRRSTPAG